MLLLNASSQTLAGGLAANYKLIGLCPISLAASYMSPSSLYLYLYLCNIYIYISICKRITKYDNNKKLASVPSALLLPMCHHHHYG